MDAQRLVDDPLDGGIGIELQQALALGVADIANMGTSGGRPPPAAPRRKTARPRMVVKRHKPANVEPGVEIPDNGPHSTGSSRSAELHHEITGIIRLHLMLPTKPPPSEAG